MDEKSIHHSFHPSFVPNKGEREGANKDEIPYQNNDFEKRSADSVARSTLESPTRSQRCERSDHASVPDGINRPKYSARSLLKIDEYKATLD